MAQGAGRIVCPRCGANNFDTVTICWKCSIPLGAAAPPPAQAMHQPAASAAMPMPGTAAPLPSPAEMYAFRAASASGMMGSPDTANRAALWLGLLFPYFGLAVALAFMMCDDRRRQEVGRICLFWCLLSTAIHLLLLFMSFLGIRNYVLPILMAVSRSAGRGGGGGVPNIE